MGTSAFLARVRSSDAKARVLTDPLHEKIDPQPDSGRRTNHIESRISAGRRQSVRRKVDMHHFQTTSFQTNPGIHANQQLPQPKSSSEAAPVSLSQAELRDIVLAILG
jgi:hypothetical protein